MPSDAVGACLVEVRNVLGRAADAPVWSLDDHRVQDRLRQALAAKASLDELIARLVAQVDDRDLAKTTGASSTRAHLVGTHRLSPGAATGLVAQARAISDRTGLTRTAWADGLIHAEQAVVIGSAVDKLTADVPEHTVRAAQADLIMHAQSLTHTQLQVAANHLVEVVVPDGADQHLAAQLEADETKALEQTCFRGRSGADGIARFSGKMPNLATTCSAAPWRPSPHRAAPTTPPATATGTGTTVSATTGRAAVTVRLRRWRPRSPARPAPIPYS